MIIEDRLKPALTIVRSESGGSNPQVPLILLGLLYRFFDIFADEFSERIPRNTHQYPIVLQRLVDRLLLG